MSDARASADLRLDDAAAEAAAARLAASASAGAWGPAGPAAAASSTPTTRAAEDVWQQVQAMALRMATGVGSAGVPQVRLDIDPRLLPGVQVVLQQMSGQIQMEFVCASEGTRRRLRAVAQRELGQMAERLGRSVRVSLRRADAEGVAGDDTEHLHAGV